MFYNYEIRKNNNEDVLYLFMNMNYEFSKELVEKSTDKELKRRTSNFIKNHDINYDGNKVFLVVDGIIVKSLDIPKEEKIETLTEDIPYSNNNFMVTIELSDKSLVEVTLLDYLLGVLATNAYLVLELETLKSIAVLYRTYAYKEMKENGKIRSLNPFAIYKPISYYKLLWINEYTTIYNKLLSAIQTTDREFVTYKDGYILPFIHISNNGYTTESEEYDYLKKKASLWDYTSPHYLHIVQYSYDKITKIFECSVEDVKNMSILELNNSNRIKRIRIGKHTYSGASFKNLLSLKSDDVTILIDNNRIRFVTRGYGNALGMSQFGANEMVQSGYKYTQLIRYYFDDVQIKRYI